MSLRGRLLAYLIGIHVLFAALAGWLLWDQRVYWLAVEPVLLISVFVGARLVSAINVPLQLIRTGAELLEERDFTSSFLEVGQPEMDGLVRVYNRMVEQLREERLRLLEQNLFLGKVLAASPAGVVTLDFDGRIELLNPSAERLLGVAEAQAVGKEPRLLPSSLGAALSSVGVDTSEVVPLDGRRRIKISRAEFFDRGFGKSFFVLEELTEELRNSEKAAYEKLIRMMSHEVNNTVGATGSLLETFEGYSAQLSTEDSRDFTEALLVARSRLEHLRAFMAGFAEMVRLPPPEKRPVDVKRLLEELLLLLRPELEHRNIACEWIAPAPVPPVAMDRNQMEQVLVNVLKNSMEAIGTDGQITIELAPNGGRPSLSIRDTGGGIPEDVRAKLFTPFFSTKRDGRGLGLTLIHEILRHHDFEFALQDREPGAEFRIRLR